MDAPRRPLPRLRHGLRARSRPARELTDSGLVFDRVAEAYDRVRRGYPQKLVDAARSGLKPGARVVEVGCGTGKLTRALVDAGLDVDAVDPGRALVEVARRHVGDAVRFHVARFEDADLPAEAFDAVFSATAFHWVDPAIGWSKAARLLRPGGVLALISHGGGGSELELDAELLAAWREVLPEAAGWVSRDPQTLWAGAEARRDNVSELWAWLMKRDLGFPEAATLFGEADVSKIPVEVNETVDELLGHLRTQSSYLRLSADRAAVLERRIAAAVENAGGRYRSTIYATLVTARRHPH